MTTIPLTPFAAALASIATTTGSVGPAPWHGGLCQMIATLPRRVALSLFLLCVALLAHPCVAAPGGWDFTDSLNAGRYSHTATLLQNGTALVAGGFGSGGSLVSAELYDSATGLWSFTGSLTGKRYIHSSTLLPNGMVLIAGGYDSSFGAGHLATAELYNPATGTWSTTASLHETRSGHSAILLNTGKVLVVAGSHGSWLASAELYDPATGTWAITGSLAAARVRQSATLLPSGKVLVAGGGIGIYYASAELYDPGTGIWSPTGSLHTERSGHTATLLQNGMVLVAGGENSSGSMASAELYDPATGTWSAIASLNHARSGHTATLLPNSQVLVAGGLSSGPLASSELYDPATGVWTSTGDLKSPRYTYTATLLSNGTVLATGGQPSSTGQLASAELYGAPTVPPVTVDGQGAFDNQGNHITFNFHATEGDQQNLGNFSFCDNTAGVCAKRGRVTGLTTTGGTAELSGFVMLSGKGVDFKASVTDNGSPRTSDAISITLRNGYSASGTLTSGDILIH